MTEDKSPPVNLDPSTSPAAKQKLGTRQRKSELQELSELLQAGWQRARPILKQQSVALLRLTMRTLGGVVTRLESEPPPKPPQPHGPLVKEGLAPAPEPPQTLPTAPSTYRLLDRVRPQWQRFQGYWSQILGQIRLRIPVSLNQKLSNRALSGVIAGVIVLFLWTTTSLFLGKSKVPQTVPVPLAQRQVPRVPAPVEVQPVEISPPAAIAPPILTPSKAEPPAVETVPVPPPLLELTPEQSLIAAIQDQVAEITNRYANGLIQSIQANFQSSQLNVNVGEGWYSLSSGQQDQLARELLQRSRELEFNRITLKNNQGDLLARSPLVGPEMVILRRRIG